MRSPLLAKTLRYAAWGVACLAGVIAAFYLLLLAINWRDRPPSQAALTLAALQRDRPPVPESANAYVFMNGFAAPRAEDARAAGARRLAWLQRMAEAEEQDLGDDPAPDSLGFRSARSGQVQALIEACRDLARECFDLFESEGAALGEWLESEAWLLERYLGLLAHEEWFETVPFDERFVLPSYTLVFDGQRLLLAQALSLARRGDAAAVRHLLARDTRFWRMVLASSDLLISKMVATAALLRTFELGNLVLRALPAATAAQGMPEEWLIPLTDAERSLLRALAGEWIFLDGYLRRWQRGPPSDPGQGVMSRIAGRLTLPLFQSQDSLNRRAAEFLLVVEQLDVPLQEYPQALERAAAGLGPRDGILPVRTLYNPVGAMLLGISSSQFVPYGARVADLEGVRRAVVLANTLRAAAVGAADVTMQLGASALTHPYTGEPFKWDAAQSAIVFEGIEPAARSRHVIRY